MGPSLTRRETAVAAVLFGIVAFFVFWAWAAIDDDTISEAEILNGDTRPWPVDHSALSWVIVCVAVFLIVRLWIALHRR